MKIKNYSSEPPAWPVVVYWLASIAQYSFRYILKVNDTHTSGFGYSDTPWYLSGIKHVITVGFLVYCIGCKTRKRVNVRDRSDILILIYCASLAVGLLILGVKFAGRDGASYEVLQAWLQTWPYLIIPLLLPACMRPEQAVPTLKAFSLGAFIMTSAFWAATVYLYYTERRYPALSWPGQLRFGGILDDPNGYAALMALIIVLTVAFKGRLWLCRLALCLIMCVMTRSLAGLVVLVVALAVLALQTIAQMRGLPITATLKGVGLLICLLTALCLPDVQNALDTFAGEVTNTLQFKQKSIDLHLTDLVSPPDLGVDAGVVDWLVGSTGVSENFYSWTLINFGIIGSLFLAGSIIAAVVVLAGRVSGVGRYILAWAAGIIVGSAGIPYFRNFPVNMLFWSTISVVTQGIHVGAAVRRKRQSAPYSIAVTSYPRL